MAFLKGKDLRIGRISFNGLKNKYVIAGILFVLWVAFFDENNLIERYQSIRYLKQLNDDKEFYRRKIVEDNRKLDDLKSNENLERFAREQFYMKKQDEDVFLIIEE